MTEWAKEPIPGGWAYTNNGDTIRLEFIHPTARGLYAWVELSTTDQPIPVAQGNRDLMHPNAIDPFAKQAHTITGRSWMTGLRQAFHETILNHRDGATTVDLSTVTPEPLQFLVDPILEKGGATRLIAAGGSGKSLLAMAVCLTVATGREFLSLKPSVRGPVLYLDWETDADTHARRITALCEPHNAPPPEPDLMMYRFESVPLFRSAQSVRRICDRYGITMIVVDSAKMAAGPSGGSGSSAEDSTLNLYLALREIGRPTLIIDHKTKEDIAKGRRGGYGSVFYENLARMQWEMTKLVDITPTERSFVLELSKQNNVGAQPPLGFKLETKGGTTGIESAQFIRQDPNTLPDPTIDDMPERIASLLAGAAEPLPVMRIAELLYGREEGKKRSASIRSRLNQDQRFANVSQSNVGAWTMRDKERAQHELEEWNGETF